MAEQPPPAAVGDPLDPPLFCSFRPKEHRSAPVVSNPTPAGSNPSSAMSSSYAYRAATPSGFFNHRPSWLMSQRRSYAEVLKPDALKSKIPADLHLFGKVNPHPGVRSFLRDGATVVSISNEVNDVLFEPFKWALVGKFSHGVPKLNQIGKFLVSLKLIGKFQLYWLSPRQIMIIFGEETDFVRVWLGRLWQVSGFPMRMIKWAPSFDPKVESPIVPVWVRLPGLPAHFFDRGILFEIDTNLGKPIRVDTATTFRTKRSEARLCVELDLLLPRSDFIFLEFDGQLRKQRIVFENVPIFCSYCSHVGHGVDVCYGANENIKHDAFEVADPSSAMVQLKAVNNQSEMKPVVTKSLVVLDLKLHRFPLFKLPVGLSIKEAVWVDSSSICSISEIEEGEIVDDGGGRGDFSVGLKGDGDVGFEGAVMVFGEDVQPPNASISMHACDQTPSESVDSGLLTSGGDVINYGNKTGSVHAVSSLVSYENSGLSMLYGNSQNDGVEDDILVQKGLDVSDSTFNNFSGSAALAVEVGLHVTDLEAQDKVKTEEGQMDLDPVPITLDALNVVAMESVDLHGDFGNLRMEEKVAAVMVEDGLVDVTSHAAVVHGDSRNLRMEEKVAAVMVEDGHVDVTSHASVRFDVTTFNAYECAAVIGEGVGSRSDGDALVVVGGEEFMCSDVTGAGLDSATKLGQDVGFKISSLLVRPGEDSVGPVSGNIDGHGCDSFGLPTVISHPNGLQYDGSIFTGKINEATKTLNEAAVSPQQNEFQLDRPVHRDKINETTKTSKPFRLVKDKRQMDKMDGILKSSFLRKPVRNVHANSYPAASEAVKTPLQLAQEELVKGGAFHDFVITDSHTSKKFSNMDFMARRSWADKMEDDVD